ncbi:MAG: TraB/GumN family protein [Cyclobacteriaceae bacterium]|nr:TraB/GumN family protein [Cyclobacteriaceae bacterium]
MRQLFRLFQILLLTIGLVASHTAPGQSGKGLVWKITGKGLKEPSYLFGTYHLLTNSYLNEISQVKQSLAKTKGVVVEAVIDSSKLQSMAMMAIMPDKKISGMISPEEAKLVSAELEALMGVNLAAVDQLKPSSVIVLMTVLYAQKLNAMILKKYPGQPMDVHLATVAKRDLKTVTPLETIEQQMDLLYNHFPLEEQARQLVIFVKQKEISEQSQAKLLEIYLEHDLEKLYRYADSLPKDMGNSDFLLKDRNEAWMKTLPGLMAKESQFIAVGALHLAGPDGLISLLQKQGYTVTPVN